MINIHTYIHIHTHTYIHTYHDHVLHVCIAYTYSLHTMIIYTHHTTSSLQAIPHTEIRIDVRHDVPYCSTCKAVRPGPDKERTQKGRAGATLRNPPEAASRRTIKHRAQQIQSSTMRPR